MLQSLVSLSDEDIELVTGAVSRWCAENHCDIDSDQGRRALSTAIDLVQLNYSGDALFEQLTERLNGRTTLHDKIDQQGSASI